MKLKEAESLSKNAFHLVVLIALVLLILGLVTWLGVIRCSLIPGWCNIYYGVLGEPRILIVYGDDGLGSPQKLYEYLRDPRTVSADVQIRHMQSLNVENLKRFNLVIVEKAKTMSTDQMKMFIDYADAGGKIIWTADAGTALAPGDEQLKKSDIFVDGSDELIGVWARKGTSTRNFGLIINLENTISVHFEGNYCEKNSCTSNDRAGKLIPIDSDHFLVYGIRSDLTYFGDFSVVSDVKGVGTQKIMDIDTDRPVKINDKSLGENHPIILSSGLFSQKVFYYAVPIEQLITEPNNYSEFIRNLYYGILY
ncbi:MAG TPA: hypothetical protein VJK05_03945 [archaeon]|nr:hypothetical protein [archaeon]